MSKSDNYNFEMSRNDDLNEVLFDNKKYIRLSDSNNNYSNNQISYQLSSLSNTNNYVNWAECYLVIPLCFTITSSTANKQFSTTDIKNTKLFCLKNNLHLINSLTIQCDGKPIHQSSANLNEWLNFDKLVSLNKNMVDQLDYLNFYPDDAENWNYETSTKESVNFNMFDASDNLTGFNKRNSIFLNGGGGSTINIKKGNSLMSDNLNQKPICKILDGSISYHWNAVLKLSDLSDYFKKVGVSKTFTEINIGVNMGSFNVGVTTATNADPNIASFDKITSFTSSFQFNTNPCQLNLKNLVLGTSTTTNTYNLNCVLKINNDYATGTNIYAPVLVPSPSVLNSYISNPTRTFYFDDVFYTNIEKVGASSSINFNVSNGKTNLKGILLVPYVHSSKNIIGTSQIYPPLNCFDNSPNTTSPLLTLSNLNIILGGSSVQTNANDYDYMMFLQNIYGLKSITGGSNLENGLISLNKFYNNYRFYYFNLNDNGDNENVSKSIQITGINKSAVDVSINVYVIYTKKVLIDKIEGKILDIQ